MAFAERTAPKLVTVRTGFDVARMYRVYNGALPGDLLRVDPETVFDAHRCGPAAYRLHVAGGTIIVDALDVCLLQ